MKLKRFPPQKLKNGGLKEEHGQKEGQGGLNQRRGEEEKEEGELLRKRKAS